MQLNNTKKCCIFFTRTLHFQKVVLKHKKKTKHWFQETFPNATYHLAFTIIILLHHTVKHPYAFSSASQSSLIIHALFVGFSSWQHRRVCIWQAAAVPFPAYLLPTHAWNPSDVKRWEQDLCKTKREADQDAFIVYSPRYCSSCFFKMINSPSCQCLYSVFSAGERLNCCLVATPDKKAINFSLMTLNLISR